MALYLLFVPKPAAHLLGSLALALVLYRQHCCCAGASVAVCVFNWCFVSIRLSRQYNMQPGRGQCLGACREAVGAAARVHKVLGGGRFQLGLVAGQEAGCAPALRGPDAHELGARRGRAPFHQRRRPLLRPMARLPVRTCFLPVGTTSQCKCTGARRRARTVGRCTSS